MSSRIGEGWSTEPRLEELTKERVAMFEAPGTLVVLDAGNTSVFRDLEPVRLYICRDWAVADS